MSTPLQQALQTYLDHLAVERGLAANTLSSYRRDLRRYLAHLAERVAAAMMTDDVLIAPQELQRRDGDENVAARPADPCQLGERSRVVVDVLDDVEGSD